MSQIESLKSDIFAKFGDQKISLTTTQVGDHVLESPKAVIPALLRYLKEYAGYNFLNSSSTQGLFLINQSRGPLVGLSLNWNLYNGIQRKQVENTKLLRENVRLAYDETKVNLQATVITAWQANQDAILLAKLEKENYKLAAENLNIITQRFKLGEATTLELKDAQQLNEASISRLANSLFEAKNAETELLLMVGELNRN